MPLTARLHSLLAAIALVGACSSGDRLEPLNQGPPLPSGIDGPEVAVDGLEVGHRLMAAGEYQLALRAYTRAAGQDGATVDVLSAIGSANLRLGRLGQAELYLHRALERDPNFVPALNNLGVVLMERGNYGEASRVFRAAFALDSGQSAQIRENLRVSLAKFENAGYVDPNNNKLSLVRRGNGRYLLLSTP
ncbi:tetratricopeptide (TPR) repeat protein [Rhodobacteraceae bacterium MBR-64]